MDRRQLWFLRLVIQVHFWTWAYKVRNGLYRLYLGLAHHFLAVAHRHGQEAKRCSQKLHRLLD